MEVEALLHLCGEAAPSPNFRGCYFFQPEDKLLRAVVVEQSLCFFSGKGPATRNHLRKPFPQVAKIPDRDYGLELAQLFLLDQIPFLFLLRNE